MAATDFFQSNFTSGELSPKLAGHIDFAKFPNGAELIRNFIVMPQGGVVRRPGSVFASRAFRTTRSRLVPFIFTQGDAYMIEMGSFWLRVFQNDEIIYDLSFAITNITWAAGLAEVTIGAHSLIAGNETVKITGVTPSESNRTSEPIQSATATTVRIPMKFDPGTYVGGGTLETTLTVQHSFGVSLLSRLKYAQIADIIYFVHPDVHPQQLIRNSATSWTMQDVVFLDGPYLPINAGTTTLQPSAATGAGITITASAVTGINNDQGFLSTDVGRFVRIKNGATWGYAKIVGLTDTTHVTADVIIDFAAATAIATWQLGAFSDTTGYPGAVAFHQQRVFYASTAEQPTTIWGSKTADYDNMAATELDASVVADNAIVNTIASGEVNIYRWLATGRTMAAGGNGEITNYKGGERSGGITADSVPEVRPASTFGVDPTANPVRIGDELLFIQRGGRKIRAMKFVFESDGFAAPDLTILSDHITAKGSKSISGAHSREMAYAEQPGSLLMCVVDADGIAGCTFNQDEKLNAWHSHIFGGVFTGVTAADAPVIESIAVIPREPVDATGLAHPKAGYDQIWLCVKRTIDGEQVRTIEYLSNNYDSETEQPGAFPLRALAVHVDSAVIYSDTGTAVSELTGLHHLEGEELEVYADGATHSPQTVLDGKITLDYTANRIVAGLGYNSDLEPPRLTAGRRLGGIQGKTRKITHATIYLKDAGELSFGEDSESLDPVLFRDPDTLSDGAVPLFTGIKTLPWPGKYSTDKPGLLRVSGPQPCSILGIGLHVDIGDRP